MPRGEKVILKLGISIYISIDVIEIILFTKKIRKVILL